MDIKEILQKNKGDLNKMLKEKREHLRQLRFDLASGKVKNIKEIREIRKDIAKILTLINRK